MGWRPRDVYDCSVPEFWAALDGWRRAQGHTENAEPMTLAELHDLIKDYDPNE